MKDMDNDTLYWLAGLLEGEGSFCKPPPSSPNSVVVSMQSTDEDIIQKVADIFEVKYHKVTRRNDKWKDSFIVGVRGMNAYNLMVRLKPLMGARRQTQIQAALDSYDPERRNKAILNSRKLSEENLQWASQEMERGVSLRACARALDVHHESLRRALQDTNRYNLI